MLYDFSRFLYHAGKTLSFTGGIFLALASLLLCLSLLFTYLEGIGFYEGLYFTTITALTVGYGDITPKTVGGRTLSLAIGIVGVIFAGLVVAVANRALAEAMQDKRADSDN